MKFVLLCLAILVTLPAFAQIKTSVVTVPIDTAHHGTMRSCQEAANAVRATLANLKIEVSVSSASSGGDGYNWVDCTITTAYALVEDQKEKVNKLTDELNTCHDQLNACFAGKTSAKVNNTLRSSITKDTDTKSVTKKSIKGTKQ